MLVTDVNGDGLNDIIIGSDHGYGLAWYEQKKDGGKRTFVRHWIETDYPTFHTMVLADSGRRRQAGTDHRQAVVCAQRRRRRAVLSRSSCSTTSSRRAAFERHILSYSYLLPYFATEQGRPAAELRGRRGHAAPGGGYGRRRPAGRCGGVPDRPVHLLQQGPFSQNTGHQLPAEPGKLSFPCGVGGASATRAEEEAINDRAWIATP